MSWEVAMLDGIGSQTGKKAVVTGSNTGIGYETARMLALKGAEVILACRNRDKAQQALENIQAEVPDAALSLLELDLSSLESVKASAAKLMERHSRLDILINNAGLMMPPLQKTSDGFESQFGTNVLGHFALSGLCLPLLENSESARVVWLSSLAHQSGTIEFDNLNAEQFYSKWGAYAQSKLADLMLAHEMQRRVENHRLPIISLGAHPGGTRSELSRNNTLLKLTNVLLKPFLQSAMQGAMPTMLAATSPQACGGDYFGPSGFRAFTGPAAKQAPSVRSHDEETAARLWQACEQLTGVSFLNRHT